MFGWWECGEWVLGLFFVGYSFLQVVGVVEVDVDEIGEICVVYFWVVIDVGFIVLLDNVYNQIEGGIVFGIFSFFSEWIDIENGEVVQNNYYDYFIICVN